MSHSYSLAMGALAEDIEVQLRQQGLTLGDQECAQRIQRWANEISSLGIHGLLTEAERDRARKRLLKEIRPLVREKVEGGSIEIPTSELRPVLEEAYDPNMPDWAALISYDDGEFYVA